MAAAARPGPADARIPCPLCGGLIHPIAGRCKHCKGDLSVLRSQRPAAAAALPALNHAIAPFPDGNGNGHAAHYGHQLPGSTTQTPPPINPVHALAAVAPIPLAIRHPLHGHDDVAQPILPPRPTGRMHATALPGATWKSWPIVVIVLAALAIIVAIILMLWPPSATKDAGTKDPASPAPDRMDTNPKPRANTSPDPWSHGGGGGAPTRPAVPVPDIDDPSLNPGTRDPFSRRNTGVGSPEMMFSIFKHACSRLKSCGTPSPQLKDLCDSYSTMQQINPPSCAAATRCLKHIDEMSCDAQLDDPMKLLQLKDKFTDCADAMSC